MAICEKCWADAYLDAAYTGKTQYECYQELLLKRKDNPCEASEVSHTKSGDFYTSYYLVVTAMSGNTPSSIVHVVRASSRDEAISSTNEVIIQSGETPTGTDKAVKLNMSKLQEVLHCDCCTGIW